MLYYYAIALFLIEKSFVFRVKNVVLYGENIELLKFSWIKFIIKYYCTILINDNRILGVEG